MSKTYKNKIKKKTKKAVEKALKKSAFLRVVAIILILAVIAGCAYYYFFIYKKKTLPPATGDLSFHFMMLGNEYAGDSIYVKAGDTDILIDAGSRKDSIDDVKSYVDTYCTDGILEYVVATHADQDHIAGFAGNNSIFHKYKCKTIIDFPISEKKTATYNEYKQNRDAEVSGDGAVHYTALECYKEINGAKRVYTLAESITMEILYHKYYEEDADHENDYSVCLLFRHGAKSFLFTGDLEEDGEISLVNNNDISNVDLYKAGHHGSNTSSHKDLLNEARPKICVVSCVAGTDEYTDVIANQFPTQNFINRISKYTNKVYVTSIGDTEFTNGQKFAPLNGNVVVISDGENPVTVNCSNNNTLLKDTAWFKAKRTLPQYWAAA